jgi:UDP-N-acetylmuramoyl-tripeptide--D-alanyl-D-alanine ligase
MIMNIFLLPIFSLILLSFLVLVWLVKLTFRNFEFLHILQLENYWNSKYLKWAFKSSKRFFDVREILAFCVLAPIGLVTYIISPLFSSYTVSLCGIIILIYLLITRKKPNHKKPLVYTSRAIRILTMANIISIIILVVTYLLIAYITIKMLSLESLFITAIAFVIAVFISNQLTALSIVFSNIILFPLQRVINLAYLFSAKNKIRKLNPKVIAITGSYGKTSTKYILASLLSKKYNVLKTPESYNTLMGVCKVIREQLNSEHELFIVEMGAYKKGDIKELCKLVKPDIGILTAIGPQHLERFGNIDNIARAKYELIESLNSGGSAIFNVDDEICKRLADETNAINVIRFGIDTKNKLDIVAKEINVSNLGLSFILQNQFGENSLFETRLLGEHNIYNILAATSVALELGMSVKEVSEVAMKLEPAPHRLQLIQNNTKITTIDDSYNSNPLGAKTALGVLSQLKGGKKILVTPGMVELGGIEFDENKKFGANAAEVCDFIILVGKQRAVPILEGLNTKQFPKEKIHIAINLDDATLKLREIIKPGDIVLFENDLPDNYSET